MALRAFALFFAAILIAASPVQAQTSQDEVKATFVYRFASFVSWPAASFTDASTPIRLCVLGANPFARALQRAVAGQRSDARSFDVRTIAGINELNGCHAVYVQGERTEATLRAARQRPVLTITDGGDERGMIHFVQVEDRVRFHIDDAAAAEGRLAIDPRLLNLALSVRRRAGA